MIAFVCLVRYMGSSLRSCIMSIVNHHLTHSLALLDAIRSKL